MATLLLSIKIVDSSAQTLASWQLKAKQQALHPSSETKQLEIGYVYGHRTSGRATRISKGDAGVPLLGHWCVHVIST